MHAKSLLARWASLLWILGIGAAAAAMALAPAHGECGFKFVLGAPCPGCGMTRAVVALLGGRLGESWRLHPLAIPAVLLAAAAVATAAHEGATGRPTFRRPAERWAGPLAVTLLALGAGVWIARVVVHPAWSPDPIRPGSLAARILG